MEKDNFIEVLKHYSESSEEEALQVRSLKEAFPYSQMLHALSARLSKDHSFTDHQKELQTAAIYAADRSVLKDVMTLKNLVAVGPKPAEKKVVRNVAVTTSPVLQVEEPVTLADQVMSDLEKLHEAKHRFELLFVDSGEIEVKTVGKKEPEPIPSKSASSAPNSHQDSKSRKARIVELAKAMAAAKESAPAEEEMPKPKKKKDYGADSFIEEIATKKEALEPENEKQKEQLEIIDQFIKTQPSISSPKEKQIPTPPGDLTTIKAGEFSDNVVSETLVEILIKQGKKDKAIELLKKLIWKFPQKKAYFAAQIEELKRS